MDEIKRKELLIKFIIENGLTFNTTGSSLNSDCCIISGYALYIGVENMNELQEAIDESVAEPGMYYDELERVFEYANQNDYGAYWLTADAKLQYKF